MVMHFSQKKDIRKQLLHIPLLLLIKPAETYPKTQIEKINTLIAEQKKLDDNYLAAITTADQFFESKKYTEAIIDYRKALALKPSEKYPSEKIAEAEKQHC